MKEIIQKFNKSKILAIGDLMIDRYLYGSVTRLSPEAPVPIVNIEKESYELGGAANAVNTIKNLGGTVDAIGIIGTDDAGRILLDLLNKKGINTNGIILSDDRKTTLKTRIIGNDCQIARLDRETQETIDTETSDAILEYIKDHICEFDAILISDYDKGLISQQLLSGLMSLAKLHNIPTIVNSKAKDMSQFKNVTLMISDLFYASEVVGIKPINETSVRNVGQWILTHLDCIGVLIIRGKEGMSLFDRNEGIKNYCRDSSDKGDATGISDILTGVMALSLANGLDLQTATAIANVAANIAYNKKGVPTVTTKELLEQIT